MCLGCHNKIWLLVPELFYKAEWLAHGRGGQHNQNWIITGHSNANTNLCSSIKKWEHKTIWTMWEKLQSHAKQNYEHSPRAVFHPTMVLEDDHSAHVRVFWGVFFIWERQSTWVEDRGRGKEKERENPKQVQHTAQSPTRGSIPQPWDQDLSWNQEVLNKLSHPASPFYVSFNINTTATFQNAGQNFNMLLTLKINYGMAFTKYIPGRLWNQGNIQ